VLAALFANGGPALWPQPASSLAEWLMWGACMSAAALLAGWGVLNRNRPSRDALVCVALVLAFALVATATALSAKRSHERQQGQHLREAGQLGAPE
jgi:hypothetical protein